MLTEEPKAFLLARLERIGGEVYPTHFGIFSERQPSMAASRESPACWAEILVGYGDDFAAARADIMTSLESSLWYSWLKSKVVV